MERVPNLSQLEAWIQVATVENDHYVILEQDLYNGRLFVQRIDHGNDNVELRVQKQSESKEKRGVSEEEKIRMTLAD